ncbi:MAG TPA: hypothetical protein VJ837_03455, partial [Candidatus Paceibacterota bacterium]|nr:hypothetical protein [Candidatus Paceibacterota bacterium]
LPELTEHQDDPTSLTRPPETCLPRTRRAGAREAIRALIEAVLLERTSEYHAEGRPDGNAERARRLGTRV